VSAYRKLRERLCSGYTAGQDELEALCYEYDAEYFPLGGGSGTCLVACASSDALTELCANVAKSEDGSEGRAVLPFRVRREGLALTGFEENGLRRPAGAPRPPPL
jgi:hypothetical protein